MTTHKFSKIQKAFVPWLILVLIVVTELATQIYTPSLPQISNIFGVSEFITELTITMNIIGIALSGLIYGPLSDCYGRRPIILIGMAIFCIASVLCIFSSSMNILILFRFMQGIGAGVAIVVGISSIQDIYKGEECAKIFATLGMVIALSPGIAPIIGGYLAEGFPWWSSFLVIAILAVLSMGLLSFMLSETLVSSKRQQFSIKGIINIYIKLLNLPPYMRAMSIRIFTMGWFWGEMANLPFVYIDGMQLPPHHYGYVWGFGIFFYILSNISLRKILPWLGIHKTMILGASLCLISIAMQIALYPLFDWTPWGLHALKIPAIMGVAYIITTSTTIVLEAAGKDSGAGSALMIGCQMALGSLFVMIESFFFNHTIVPILVGSLIGILVTCIFTFATIKSQTLPSIG
jgi:MFS transporter, DHA1 family, multidrug resistance protein